MEVLLQNIYEWFLIRKEHLQVFADADSRVEGWFKAEFLVLLKRLLDDSVIESFEREAKIKSLTGRRQIDFELSIMGEQHLCELKALCISQAAGTPRNLRFYLREDGVGLIKDFRKLDVLPHKL